nr:MAG: replication associated protein [Cressdnaviricota sp.]
MVEVVPLVPVKDEGNTRRPHPSRHWFFTLNNPSEEDMDYWRTPQNSGARKWVVQMEIGDSDTPHLQGYVDFLTKVRPIGMYHNGYHWEKVKNIEQAIKYCSKIETRIGGPWFNGIAKPESFKLEVLRPWQVELLLMLNGLPDNRTVIWVIDPVGGCGKTVFCKHLCSTRRALYTNGKAADCKYAITEWFASGKLLDMVLFDFTRSVENYISYEAIESIKNGIFFSTKYESKMEIFCCPHVVCFSNFEPDLSKLSADRWLIIRPGLEGLLPIQEPLPANPGLDV